MKKGFYTIMSAQFFSSLADNALFVAAVEPGLGGGLEVVLGPVRPGLQALVGHLTVGAGLPVFVHQLAGHGPGELDVSWFCEMNRMRSAGMGIAPLPGFPDDDATWNRWEQLQGRPAQDRNWYHLYSAYRVAIFMQLYLAAMVHRGRLPADHRVVADNSGTRRLAELLAGLTREALLAMAGKARALVKPQAAARVADQIEGLVAA